MADHHFKSQTLRLAVGIILVLAGCLISFLLIKSQYDDCAYRWINDLDAFGKKYASVWDCFVTRSKGAVVIALVAGGIPFSIGCRLVFCR